MAQRADLADGEDDGAVPRNLVIPRPEAQQPAAAPKPARKKVTRGVKRRVPVPAGAGTDDQDALDFQALLKLARKGS